MLASGSLPSRVIHPIWFGCLAWFPDQASVYCIIGWLGDQPRTELHPRSGERGYGERGYGSLRSYRRQTVAEAAGRVTIHPRSTRAWLRVDRDSSTLYASVATGGRSGGPPGGSSTLYANVATASVATVARDLRDRDPESPDDASTLYASVATGAESPDRLAVHPRSTRAWLQRAWLPRAWLPRAWLRDASDAGCPSCNSASNS
jgi:hypothetical protein